MHKIFAVIVVGACLVGAASAQQFEVASVKPAGPVDPQKILSGQQRIGMKVAGANVDIESLGLQELLYLAFKMRPGQIQGPSWLVATDPVALMSAPRFDIHAKLPAGASKDDVPQMLQALLADRFKLMFHRERKEQDVYALVVGKNGSKLQPSPPEDPADPQAGTRPDPVQISGSPQTGLTVRANGASGPMRMEMGPDGIMHMTADRMTLDQVAAAVERFAGRPVVDNTGLSGTYKISIDLSMADLMAAARSAGVNVPGAPPAGGAASSVPSDPAGTSVFQSIEKMGLRLEPRKSAVEYLVIDRVDKTPTED